MSNNSTESPAVIIDRFFQRIAIGVTLLGLSYALSAASYIVSEDIASYIGPLKTLLSIMVLVVVFPAFWTFMKLDKKIRSLCYEPDSFIVEMFKNACVRAFSITFVTLIILELLSEVHFPELAPSFFLNIALWISLDVFALTFFMSTLASDDDEDDLEDEA